MGLIDSISNLKAAETMSKVQYAVAAKVLQATRDAGEATVQLIEAAAETMDQAVTQVVQDLGSNFDTFA
jgi:hypothetical protein